MLRSPGMAETAGDHGDGFSRTDTKGADQSDVLGFPGRYRTAMPTAIVLTLPAGAVK